MAKLTWLITGCSSGFGREFVHQIRARGDDVIATARNIDKIRDLESTGAKLLQLDVTSPQTDINKLMEEAVSLFGKVDVLVNNAGYVCSGSWEDLTYAKSPQTLELWVITAHINLQVRRLPRLV